MKKYQKNLMVETRAIYGVYGAGGCGRGLIPFVYQNFFSKFAKIIFIDDNLKNKNIDGYQVISYVAFKKLNIKKKFLLIGISDVKIRKRISQIIKKDKLKLFSLFSKQSIIFEKKNIGVGSSISPFVTITSNVNIGKFFHINLYSYVEHDCNIGNFVTFAPGVKCNGNVIIEDNVFVGSGVIIKNGLPNKKIIIGRNSVIGAGAVITKNVPPNSIIVGNPAKKLIR
jgi:sugar O-acyltransferase (sialic acid O-acetyltransferase NeuD family)